MPAEMLLTMSGTFINKNKDFVIKNFLSLIFGATNGKILKMNVYAVPRILLTKSDNRWRLKKRQYLKLKYEI